MDAPQPVEMTGISLSPKAFTINLADAAYVFDQESLDWSHPSLHQQCYPPIPTNYTYLTNDTSSDASSLSTPLGAIIGGVVGGVVSIALVLFFVFRRRREGYQKADASEAASQEIEFFDHHKMPELATNYVVMQPKPHLHLQNQVVSTLPPPHDAYAMSPQTPCYNSHADLNLVHAANNIQAPIPVYHEVQPVVKINPDSYLQPYTYATPTVVSMHSSPTIFQAQVAQDHDQFLDGSPLTVYEPLLKYADPHRP
ncbi:hypothetical protein BGZ96_001364 [Linnemannia gamsii]|uniref:Uncharacterized protein n=1 Tax=Linnemannia gamsii TaxID=64522 RepID=A0ABQ7JMM8_9FUNG|nr:hypothetical protein BGZ96_001364 [Linnemannia gamsii]